MNFIDKIKQRVNDINDPKLLGELLKAVDLEYEIENLEELTSIEKKAIDEGIKDAENGNLHSNSEASQLVKEWLKQLGGLRHQLLIEAKFLNFGRRKTNLIFTLRS